MIIGTAGHIDHGKSSLIKALTGADTDRLKEEKARGITIDLGFTYLLTGDGSAIGFVDVPGHERFVHTMIAGASGIDLALLTVAADDGCKPQTYEHISIIDLLGIRRSLVALTKVDLVSPERVVAVTEDIRMALAGTCLEPADIVPVSTKTGEGIDVLKNRLFAVSNTIPPHDRSGAFRMAIDRSFILTGAGVVVTGFVSSGTARIGDHIMISPAGFPARIRGLHRQNCPADEGRAGDRCALNLVGGDITKNAIHRGHVALDPALHAPADRIDATLRLLPSERRAIGQWFPVRLHHAATDVGARIVLLNEKFAAPGRTTTVQLVLERPVAAALGDRYILRDVSAQRTLGGGRFLDLRAPARKRRTPERHLQLSALALPDVVSSLRALLDISPYYWDFSTFVRDHALSQSQAREIVDKLKLMALQNNDSTIAMLPDRWRGFVDSLLREIATFHSENPDLQGIGRERLRLLLQPRLPSGSFGFALQILSDEKHIALEGSFVRLISHTVRMTERDEVLWAEITPLLAGPQRFRPPRVRDIAKALDEPEDSIRRLLKVAARLGRTDEIAHDHFFLRATVREMVAIAVAIVAVSQGGEFTAAQFRDRVANGRKVAIQILEFFDKHGITFKREDLRRLNKHRLDLFGPIAINEH